MRFQSTVRVLHMKKTETGMRPTRKTAKARSKAPARASSCMENVLEACVQLPTLSGDPPVLRQYIAESARKIFEAVVAGMMVRDGESFLPGAVCTDVDEPAGKKALLE